MMNDLEQNLRDAAVEYRLSFIETDPRKESDRRILAHQALVRAALRYAASVGK